MSQKPYIESDGSKIQEILARLERLERVSIPYGTLETISDISQLTADNSERLSVVQNSLEGSSSGSTPTLVTSLPASPTNGQEIYYQPQSGSAPWIIWHLRYDSSFASTSKWVFLGGSPLFGKNTSGDPSGVSETIVDTSASWLQVAQQSPQITVPLKGDYRFEWGMQVYTNVNSGAQIDLVIGNAGQTVLSYRVRQGVSLFQIESMRGEDRLDAVAGNQTFYMYLWANSTQSSGFVTFDRYLKVTPIRVG